MTCLNQDLFQSYQMTRNTLAEQQQSRVSMVVALGGGARTPLLCHLPQTLTRDDQRVFRSRWYSSMCFFFVTPLADISRDSIQNRWTPKLLASSLLQLGCVGCIAL